MQSFSLEVTVFKQKSLLSIKTNNVHQKVKFYAFLVLCNYNDNAISIYYKDFQFNIFVLTDLLLPSIKY